MKQDNVNNLMLHSRLNKIERGYGPTTSRPIAPAKSIEYFDTDLGKAIWWNKTEWVDAFGVNPDVIPGVRIRYTSTDDLTGLDVFAVGGTAYITDNGDGTYDLWSDDNCEFVALDGYYYYIYDGDLKKVSNSKRDC